MNIEIIIYDEYIIQEAKDAFLQDMGDIRSISR
jgi:hypothetical protein